MKKINQRTTNNEQRPTRVSSVANPVVAPSVVGSANFPGAMGGGRPRPPGGRDGRPPVFVPKLRGENPSSSVVNPVVVSSCLRGKKLEVRSEKLEESGSAALHNSSNSYLLTSNSSSNSSRQRRAAFTLIEMLVVLSIIVLLIAILVPAAILAERYAYSSATQGDLAAIGQALSAYHSDFNMYPDSDLCVPPTGKGIYGAASGIAGQVGPVTIPQGAAYDYLTECLTGYLPGEEDGAPGNSALAANGYTAGNISQCAGFTMQPYKKVYGPYMPVNAQNITPDGNGNYYFSGDFPPTAGTPLPILYFSATPSPSTNAIFGDAPGVGIFCYADDGANVPSSPQFFQLIGSSTGANLASGGTITGRNSYLLVAPGPSQAAYGGDSLVYGGQ